MFAGIKSAMLHGSWVKALLNSCYARLRSAMWFARTVTVSGLGWKAFMRIFRRITAVVLAVLFGLPLLLWLTSYIKWPSEQDRCAFGSVQNAEYRRLLASAKAQQWSVWPGLSNGIFWRSDRYLRLPTVDHDKK